METDPHQNQIRTIYQMLFEMATGNLSFRLKETDEQNGLDKIINTLNALSGEMQSTILQSGYVNPHYTFQNLTQNTFMLNSEFHILSFSVNVPIILGFKPETLYKTEFSNIMAHLSIPVWNNIKQEITADENYQTAIPLIFVNQEERLVPCFCTVSKLLYSDNILISSVTTSLQDITEHTNRAPRKSDAAIIQNVYDYIMNHLDHQLPTIKELSQMFGTNDFKLKDGFRHFFNTSIYKFYTQERLKKAYLLIQQTSVPLKEIAFMSGFNDYTNFSKAFKKQYHYPPSDLKREENENDSATF